MPKIKYQDLTLSAKTLATISTANTIIADYAAQGYDLTLRQLYYQFVARGLILNAEKSYKALGEAINSGRMAGLIDWDAINDRTRYLRDRATWLSPKDIIKASAQSFRMDLWELQNHRIEVWVEKDALIGVLEVICPKLRVPYFSCRGYVSQSEMWGAAQRLKSWEHYGQKTILLHLGDHDPSGIDMTRDITDRLKIFGAKTKIERIALNMDQITKYAPPPNPAKVTDSRFADYQKEYGDESWELDALSPTVLSALIADHVAKCRDEKRWALAKAKEDAGKKICIAISDKFDRVEKVVQKWADKIKLDDDQGDVDPD